MATDVWVYADWEIFSQPTLIGKLRSDTIRNGEHFSFCYDETWLVSPFVQKIDPDLELWSGEQHSQNAHNFRVFLDSCPDRWGRLLMKRREAILARQQKRRPRILNEIDYLLGVHDFHRQGALRFRQSIDGPFLDNNQKFTAPPMASLKELAFAAQQVEKANDDEPEYLQWLLLLMAPGSSLGGARPKASVRDDHNNLWIAKFPSGHDGYDVAAWEFLAHRLAVEAGIEMAECQITRYENVHHTFLTKRFDRQGQRRLHFTSAMTQLGYYDGDYEASYLEIAQFLVEQGAKTRDDLAQLWRRIVFNIAISNSDDHLRNHGFVYQEKGWVLSPAYDINPVPDAHGLHLNINEAENSLDYALAMSVIDYFQLSARQAEKIKGEVLASVSQWRAVANTLNISRSEQERMASAFRI